MIRITMESVGSSVKMTIRAILVADLPLCSGKSHAVQVMF